jgi:outer membrane protein OmpA-like peptidoglycan-associated protein
MNAFGALATRSIVAGLGLIALTAAERPLQARQAEPLLQPTPLVLKDGRIASVSIHVVPFAPGQADLGGEAAARIAELTRAVGTDCFLTAQVIGHIGSNEVGQDDTLNAHRLARSRADAVQASLIGGGLPAKAIASVWDWQFMVRAPRATLWIFQLTAGEDCDGRPLDGAMVAQAAPSTSRPAAQTERAAAQAPAARTASTAAQADEPARPVAPAAIAPDAAQSQAQAGPPSSTPARSTPPEPTALGTPAERREAGSTVATRPALAPKALTSDGEVEAPARQRGAETAVAAAPAPAANASASEKRVEQAPGQRGAGTTVAAKPEPADKNLQGAKQVEQPARQRDAGTTVAAKPAPAAKASDSDGKVERGSDASLVITFANNSSYFPAGAARRLRELIAGMNPARKYEIAVRVAVSSSSKVVGARSPQEAASYNRWLAERRMERVQNWLLENAAADALSFKPEYVTDESRQVVVRLAPVG